MTTKPQLHANLTEEEHGLLKQLAHAQGRTVTVYLGDLIKREAKKAKMVYDPTHPALAPRTSTKEQSQ